MDVDEELEFYIDRKLLAKLKVKRNKQAEFDHWGDAKVYFPKIHGGEMVTVKYQNEAVIKGTFR